MPASSEIERKRKGWPYGSEGAQSMSNFLFSFIPFNLPLLLKINLKAKTLHCSLKRFTCNVNFHCYYKESTPKKYEVVVAPKLHDIFLSESPAPSMS